MSKFERKIISLLKRDSLRQQALDCVFNLNLPDSYIAAGFIRNLVWDYLHKNTISTPLNDIDVIYFDRDVTNSNRDQSLEDNLTRQMPTLKWQVRNQADMHERNGDRPYKNCTDAMGYWPEKETAVAVRKVKGGEFECITAFGYESLFNLQLTHNPKRPVEIFNQRIQSKNWLSLWPNLTITGGLNLTK